MKTFGCLFFLIPVLSLAAPTLEESIQEKATPSPRRFAVELQYMNLRWSDLPVQGPSGPSIAGFGPGGRITFEYIPVDSVGKIGLGLGVGFNTTQKIDFGQGFTDTVGAPLDLSLSYRASYGEYQAIVPFLKGGIGAIAISHQNGPNRVNQLEGTLSYGGGLEISLGALDRFSGKDLDQGFGINDFLLIFEYRRAQMLGASHLNLSQEMISAGLRLEL